MKKVCCVVLVFFISVSMVFAVTASQSKAQKKAESYLKYSSFSYERLVDQLIFDGYSELDAKYAVDRCGADWKEQAVKKANSYLKYSSFSYSGLIDQLEYEGFTSEQAKYGVEHTALGSSNSTSFSQEQALKKAQSYLKISGFSRQGLIEQLEFEGFTNSDATYAANNCKANWNEQAERCAKNYITIMNMSASELKDQLLFEGFTSTEASYGVSAVCK